MQYRLAVVITYKYKKIKYSLPLLGVCVRREAVYCEHVYLQQKAGAS